MKFSTATLAALALATATLATANSGLPDKLQVGVKYRPDECADKSQAGDLMAM